MKERIMMALILVSVSVASALALAAINNMSSSVIKINQVRQFKMAVMNSLNIPFDSEKPEAAYEAGVEERSEAEGTFYLAGTAGAGGIAFALSGAGFWGPIDIVVGVDPADLSIKGLEILEQQETPGLGARIEEPAFRDQFRSKRMDEKIVIQIKGGKPGPNDVIAITGATISSKALEKIINDAARPYLEAVRRISHG